MSIIFFFCRIERLLFSVCLSFWSGSLLYWQLFTEMPLSRTGTRIAICASLSEEVWLTNTLMHKRLWAGENDPPCSGDGLLNNESHARTEPVFCLLQPFGLMGSHCDDLCYRLNKTQSFYRNVLKSPCGSRWKRSTSFSAPEKILISL